MRTTRHWPPSIAAFRTLGKEGSFQRKKLASVSANGFQNRLHRKRASRFEGHPRLHPCRQSGGGIPIRHDLLNHVDLLAAFPHIGSPVKRRAGIRKIVHTPVRVYYQIHEGRRCIEILHFWHVARQEPEGTLWLPEPCSVPPEPRLRCRGDVGRQHPAHSGEDPVDGRAPVGPPFVGLGASPWSPSSASTYARP